MSSTEQEKTGQRQGATFSEAGMVAIFAGKIDELFDQEWQQGKDSHFTLLKIPGLGTTPVLIVRGKDAITAIANSEKTGEIIEGVSSLAEIMSWGEFTSGGTPVVGKDVISTEMEIAGGKHDLWVSILGEHFFTKEGSAVVFARDTVQKLFTDLTRWHLEKNETENEVLLTNEDLQDLYFVLVTHFLVPNFFVDASINSIDWDYVRSYRFDFQGVQDKNSLYFFKELLGKLEGSFLAPLLSFLLSWQLGDVSKLREENQDFTTSLLDASTKIQSGFIHDLVQHELYEAENFESQEVINRADIRSLIRMFMLAGQESISATTSQLFVNIANDDELSTDPVRKAHSKTRFDQAVSDIKPARILLRQVGDQDVTMVLKNPQTGLEEEHLLPAHSNLFISMASLGGGENPHFNNQFYIGVKRCTGMLFAKTAGEEVEKWIDQNVEDVQITRDDGVKRVVLNMPQVEIQLKLK